MRLSSRVPTIANIGFPIPLLQTAGVEATPAHLCAYQPRFDWNLWFASLGSWQQNSIVPRTEELLLENDGAVLGLLAGNPFHDAPPRLVRAVLWQY